MSIQRRHFWMLQTWIRISSTRKRSGGPRLGPPAPRVHQLRRVGPDSFFACPASEGHRALEDEAVELGAVEDVGRGVADVLLRDVLTLEQDVVGQVQPAENCQRSAPMSVV